MIWRERAYKTYFEHYLKFERGNPERKKIARQFLSWKKYYGNFLPKDTAASILDLGCGSGELLLWLAHLGFRNATGIETNGRLIEEARRLGIENIHREDAREFLKNKSGVFDCVIARDFLEHFTKNEIFEILDLIHKALRPAGVFIVQTPNAESPFGTRYHYYDFTHCVGFTFSSLRHVLLSAGFNNFSLKEMGPVSAGIVSSLRLVAWEIIKMILKIYLFIETGSGKGIFTQNMIVRAEKPTS